MAMLVYEKIDNKPIDESVGMDINDVTEKQLREVLAKFDGKIMTMVNLYIDMQLLKFTAAEQDRVEVLFIDADDTSAAKYLVDPDYSMEDGSIKLLHVDYAEDTPIMATVPKAVAMKVAEHFRKTDGQLADPAKWKSYEEIFGNDDIDIDNIPF